MDAGFGPCTEACCLDCQHSAKLKPIPEAPRYKQCQKGKLVLCRRGEKGRKWRCNLVGCHCPLFEVKPPSL